MSTEVNIHEAKTHFSRLLKQVMAGEEVVIAKAGLPIAKLVPYRRATGERVPGGAKGKVFIADNFNDPLPEDILQAFGA